MKKENFISLVLSVVGVLTLGVGMCMALVPEWKAFQPGVIVGVVGLLLFLLMALVRRKMKGLPLVRLSGKAIGTAVLGIFGILTFGAGMCMTMLWPHLLIWGIAIGAIGILLLLSLIPLCRGLK